MWSSVSGPSLRRALLGLLGLPAAAVITVLVHAQITVPYPNFVTGTIADPVQVNSNFSTLANQALNRTGGAMTGAIVTLGMTPTSTDSYNVGSSGAKYKDGFFSGTMTVGVISPTTVIATSALGSGSATSSSFLRGDQAWVVPPSSDCASTIVGKVANYGPAICEVVEITSGSGITITLPAASTCTVLNNRIGLKNDVASAVTVARTGSDTIDGATSYTTVGVQYESYDFVCNAAKTGWMIR